MTFKTLIPVTAILALALPTAQASAAPKSKIKFSGAPFSVVEDDLDGNATITLSRTRSLNREVSVGWRITGGSAANGADYTGATSGRATFPAGIDTARFDIPIVDDSTEEGSETINLALHAPSKGAVAVNPKSVLTILDDDGLARAALSSSSYSAYESQGSPAVVTINRLGDSHGDLAVHVETSDGSAVNGVDYTGNVADLTWSDLDVTPRTLNVGISDPDTVCNGARTVNVTLTTLSGATPSRLGSPSSATLTIDDDDCPVSFAFSPSPDSTVAENSTDGVDVMIHRFGDRSGAVSVDWFTQDGTATDGIDYFGAPTAPDNVEQFAAGEFDVIENVALADDGALEGDETFAIGLRNASGANLAANPLATPSSATVTIVDDEQPAPSVAGTDAPGQQTGTTGGTEAGDQVVLGARQTTGCALTVKAAKKQKKFLKKKVLVLRLKSARGCKVTLRGTIGKLKTKKLTLTLKAGTAKTVKLKFTKRTFAKVAKKLRPKKLLKAAIKISERDTAAKTKSRTVRVKVAR